MKKILASIFMTVLVVGVMSSQALASAPVQPKSEDSYSHVPEAGSPTLSQDSFRDAEEQEHEVLDPPALLDDGSWEPDGVKANGFKPDWTAYTLFYVQEREQEDRILVDIRLEGPVPRSVDKVELRRRTIRDVFGDNPWFKVAAKCDAGSVGRRFVCEFAVEDAAFDQPVEFLVRGKACIFGNSLCLPVGHSPSLLLSEGVNFWASALSEVPALLVDDYDEDGVTKTDDNCVAKNNPGQENFDGDARGDVCDNDDDHDGVADGRDNCPLKKNPDQKDTNGDDRGDACPLIDIGFAERPSIAIEGPTIVDWVTLEPDDTDPGPDPDPCESNPDAEGCSEEEVADRDGDGFLDDDDQCPDEAEVIDLSTLRPADGVLDGCPNSETTTILTDDDVDIVTDYDAYGADTGGACSLGGSGATNPAAFLLLALALMPMAIRRKRS